MIASAIVVASALPICAQTVTSSSPGDTRSGASFTECFQAVSEQPTTASDDLRKPLRPQARPLSKLASLVLRDNASVQQLGPDGDIHIEGVAAQGPSAVSSHAAHESSDGPDWNQAIKFQKHAASHAAKEVNAMQASQPDTIWHPADSACVAPEALHNAASVVADAAVPTSMSKTMPEPGSAPVEESAAVIASAVPCLRPGGTLPLQVQHDGEIPEASKVEAVLANAGDEGLFFGRDSAVKASAGRADDNTSEIAGATFAYSFALQDQAPHAGQDRAEADALSRANTADMTAPPALSMPVHRLDVSLEDPSLGKLGVRAEMRGGVLHASITGGGGVAAALPELHDFLQRNTVPIHTLTVQHPPIVSALLRTTHAEPGTDTTSAREGYDRGTPSRNQSQEREHTAKKSNGDKALPAHRAGPVALIVEASTQGSTLSIHI